MVATITKSIGTDVSRDYADLTEFEAALPASLVTADEFWKGQLWNDGLILEDSGTTAVFDSTTDATRFVRLEAAAGESFMDHDFSSDPLRLDQAYGATVKGAHSADFGNCFNTGSACDFMEVHGLQFWGTDNKTKALNLGNSASHRLTNCIVLIDGGTDSRGVNLDRARLVGPCLIIQNGTGGATNDGLVTSVAAELINVTVVSPSDVSPTGDGMDIGGGGTSHVRNCAVFGFPIALTGTPDGDFNASDDATMPGASSKDSLTYADQFVNTTKADQDWKVKNASADIADGGASADADVSGFDIIGTARDATLADRSIGCWEFVPAAGDVLMGQVMM